MAGSSTAVSATVSAPPRRRSSRLGLAAVCLGFVMISVDATIVNVALRPIVDDLHGSIASAQWVVNGYALSFAALLLSAGSLADRVGARAGYLIGLAVFAAGSAVCSVATSFGMLIGARVLQGMGAAWLMPCSLALIAHSFPSVVARRRALAVWAGLASVGMAAGPVLGGVLTDLISWRAIFWVNLPVAAIAVAMLWRHVAETQRHRHPLDPIGQPLAIATLALLTAGFIVAGRRGWGSPEPLALLAGGVLAGAVFVLSQRRVAYPMVDPSLFRRRQFVVAVAIGMIFNFCLYGALFCLAVVFAEEHGLGPLQTGLAVLPLTLVMGTVAFLSGRIITRLGEWRSITAGLGAGALGGALVALNPTHGPTLLLVASSVPFGFVPMAMSAMTATAMAGAPSDRVGLASGVLNTARQTGGAFGVGVLGGLLPVGGGGLSLHVAFAGVVAAYGLGIILSLIGPRIADRPGLPRTPHRATPRTVSGQ